MILTLQQQMPELTQQSSEENQDFNYEILDAETKNIIQEHTSNIRRLMCRTAQDIIDIGQNLITVKERLRHGDFRNWLKAEFDWSVRTATRYMQVGKKFQYAELDYLDIATSALYLLAEPLTPDKARDEAISLAKEGKKITLARAKNMVSFHRQITESLGTGSVKIDDSSESVSSKTANSFELINVAQVASDVIISVGESHEKQQLTEKTRESLKIQGNEYLSVINSEPEIDESQERKKELMEIKSLLPIGHQVHIHNFKEQDKTLFGEIAEVKTRKDITVEMLVIISWQQ
jgi:hypothetical protein